MDKDDLRLMNDAQLTAYIELSGRQMLAANLLMQNSEGEARQKFQAERRRWWDLEAAALRERNRRIAEREEKQAA